MTEARNRLNTHNNSTIFNNEDHSSAYQRTHTPQNYRKSESNILQYNPTHPSDPLPTRNTVANQKYNQRSEVFDGCVEQAQSFKETTYERADARDLSPAGNKPKPIDVSPRPRKSKTQKSSIFTPNSAQAAKISPFKPLDQESILGNEAPQFYKKAINEHLDVSSDFEPKYKQTTANERKLQEFHGGLTCEFNNKKEERVESSPIKNARQAKEENLYSSHFENKRAPHTPQILKENNQLSDFTPQLRKAEMHSSAIFDERKVIEIPKEQVEKEDDTARRTNANFSDLFGTVYHSPQKKPSEKLISSSSKGSDKSSNSGKAETYDPKLQAYKNLRASHESYRPPVMNEAPEIEKQIPLNLYGSPSKAMKAKELTSSLQNFKDYTPVLASRESNLVELNLKGLATDTTDEDLKKICGSVHIVSATAEIDNFTGKCKGTGVIKVRTNSLREKDLRSLHLVLQEKGIDFKNPEKKAKVVKSKPQEVSAFVAKVKNLESSEVFGNVGRSSNQYKQNLKPSSVDKQVISQIQWKATRGS